MEPQQKQNARDAVVSAAAGGTPTAEALIDACVRDVQAVVAPPPGTTTIVHRAYARVAQRSDGFMLVEVPYTAAGDAGEIEGSYIAVSRAGSTTIDTIFASDRERLTVGEWAAYKSAERPGSLL